MLFKLAWRNIWRNKRRTLITIGATTFAVFFAVLMSAIQKGAWDHMMNSVINSYTGYVQIHSQGYWEEKTINKAFTAETVQKKMNGLEGIKSTVPRIESFALLSNNNFTHVALVIGTSPQAEDEMTNLKSRLVEGTFFEENEKAVLIGKEIGEKLKAGVGDTIVLLGQGYHGVNAAGKYLVKGLLSFGSPQLNRRMVYLPLQEAYHFYGTEGKVTSMVINLPNKEIVEPVIAELKTKLDSTKYEIMDWKEMLPELQQAREVDTAGSYIMIFILYVIIIFVIFGTILMLTKERMHEFGVLTAIGMGRRKLAITVWMEVVLLGFVGAIAGMGISAPIVYYFFKNPIDLSIMGEDAVKTYENFGVEPIFPAAFEPSLFLTQGIIIFFMATVVAIYPFWKISNLRPIDAMRD